MNFWATWCRPCLTEMPILQDAYDEINKETIFILINDQNLELTKEYMNKNKYTFEFVQLEREVFMKHGIMERPTTVLLDADFTIKKIIIQQIEQENGKEFIEFLNKNI
ncbi:MAG: TlpA disulfide reductase family protein [Polaribacter sp.]|nr:TlpA disulfide reductase family protein [Polaribacter sp.]MDG1955364.1 TlpA disulfide reductase family protein [Polaribacter sp.]MDG2074500.1 TlpA disulfide reductase family protein [Polaribacter sp.]